MTLWQGSSMNSTEYKIYHESYMANNEGTTPTHVFFCIFVTVQCTLNIALKGGKSVIFEYTILVLTMILAHTIFSQHIYTLNIMILVSNIFECIRNGTFYSLSGKKRLGEDCPSIVDSLKEGNTYCTKQIQSISCLRGLTYIITVFAILAVDFKAFRSDLRKTERYGYSLMDTGVGLFTLMSGLVHKDLENHNLKQIFKSNLKFILVLVSLGTARFWTVKALDYHEHVTEYGVHWNFFFTVAMCKLTSTVLLYISNRPLLFSVLTLMVHEYVLSRGVEAWVFSNAPRTNLISANREGLSSCLGYTALYLFAASVKKLLSNKSLKRYNVLLRLTYGGLFLWPISGIVNVYRPISRTTANSAYCLYLCAVFLIILSILYFFESINQSKGRCFQTPTILTAINQNGLIYFLVANLLTGAVNLSTQTLFVPFAYAIVILNVYMIITIVLILYLKDKGIKI